MGRTAIAARSRSFQNADDPIIAELLGLTMEELQATAYGYRPLSSYQLQKLVSYFGITHSKEFIDD